MSQNAVHERAPRIDAHAAGDFRAFDLLGFPVVVLDGGGIVWRNGASARHRVFDTLTRPSMSFDPMLHPLHRAMEQVRLAALREPTSRAFSFADGDVRLTGSALLSQTGPVDAVALFVVPQFGANVPDAPKASLTAVEQRLVDEIVQGRTVREASDAMGISYHTARKYLQVIFDKTGVRRQTELVALYSPGY